MPVIKAITILMTKGFIFRYGTDTSPVPAVKNNRVKRVCQYTKSGEYVATYESITAAAAAMETQHCVISSVVCGRKKSYKGFVFTYADFP